jgi:catechol 2,3-dioxygenase-like lactoylglutathione lyase family enzyme
MTDRATPNLPSRDLSATAAFYGRLGFVEQYRDDGWLILAHGGLTLEFFPYPGLDPATSSFGCCLRLDDVDGFHRTCLDAGLPETTHGFPRVHAPRLETSGLRIGALVDPDGTLLRLVGNPVAAAREG